MPRVRPAPRGTDTGDQPRDRHRAAPARRFAHGTGRARRHAAEPADSTSTAASARGSPARRLIEGEASSGTLANGDRERPSTERVGWRSRTAAACAPRSGRLDDPRPIIESMSATAGMSSSHVSRIERGEHRAGAHEQLVGPGRGRRTGHPNARLPGTGRPLDAAQVGLIGRLQARLPSAVTRPDRVPLPRPGDHVRGTASWRTSGASATLPFDADHPPRRCTGAAPTPATQTSRCGIRARALGRRRTRHNREWSPRPARLLSADFPRSARQVLAASPGPAPRQGRAIVLR